MKRRKVITERRVRTPQTQLQAADLRDAPFDDARLARQVYLTIPQLTQYLQFPSRHATYMWLQRTGLRKCRRGRTVLVLRRDVDQTVQPSEHLNSLAKGA